MKILVSITFLILVTTLTFGQKTKTTKKPTPCSILLKKGFTNQFCKYDSTNEFKSISFGSKFELVDSLMQLKRVSYYSNVYDIQNEKYIDWGITKFSRGYVQFTDNKFVGVTLDLMDAKGVPYYKFENILKHLTDLFGPPKVIPTSNPNITLHEWEGNKLTIDINYFNPANSGGMVTLKIFSNNSTGKGADNM